MANLGKKAHRDSGWNRGLTPQIGIVLLFGMVIAGAVTVGLMGMVLVDNLGTDAEAETARSAVGVTDHDVSTAVATGDVQTLPLDAVQGASGTVTEDGSVTIAWFDHSEETYTDGAVVEIDPLGAIEYQLEDRTIAYQGGGTWERSDGGTIVHSGPDVSYDGEQLRLNVVHIDGNGTSEVDGFADPDEARTQVLSSELEAAAQTEENPDAAIVVEDSDYHEGWYQHLTDALGDDVYENVTVTHDEGDERVEAVVRNVSPDVPVFEIQGESVPIETEVDQRLETGEDLTVVVDVSNTAVVSGTQDLSFSVDGGPTVTEEVTLSPGEETTVDLTIEADEIDLGEGVSHEYLVTTDNHEAGGSFYLGDDGDRIVIDDVDSETPNGQFDVTATVWNQGLENGTQSVEFDLESLEDFEGVQEPEYDVFEEVNTSLGYGEQATVSWTFNASQLLPGDHEFTIGVGNETWTETFEVDNEVEVDPGDGDLVFRNDAQVNVSVLGSEISNLAGSWWGNDEIESYPIETELILDDLDSEDDPERDDPWGGNVNTYENWDLALDHSTSVVANTSLTIRGESFRCTSQWQTTGEVTYEGVDYDFAECPGYTPGDSWHEADASGETTSPHVRVRDAENNQLPELHGFHDAQRSADQILEMRDVDVVEDGDDAYLDLDENEFVFLFEITDEPGDHTEYEDVHPPDYYESDEEYQQARSDAFFQEAIDTDAGDPNFNDLIVYVEVDEEEPDPVPIGYEYEGTDTGTPVETNSGDVGDPHDNADRPGVEIDAGADSVVIR